MTHTYTIEITKSSDRASWEGRLLEDGKVIKEASSEILIEVVDALEFTLNGKSSLGYVSASGRKKLYTYNSTYLCSLLLRRV